MTVLIPTHGRSILLGRTIASLAACRLPEGYRETVIVENGSRAGAEAVVAEAAGAHPHLSLRYMHVEWANKSHALNEALKTIGDGLVVFFDDDVRMDPGVLEAYAEGAAGYRDQVFFGGPMESDFEMRPTDWLLPLLPASVRGFSLEDAKQAGYYLGANWAAFATDLDAVGGFNPDFGPGSSTGARGQESEMQRRLKQAGVSPIDVPDARVWHYVPRERSSAVWALRRKYQVGLQLGTRARYDNSESYVRNALGRLARDGVTGLIGPFTGRSQELPKAVYEGTKRIGSIIGYYRSRHNQLRDGK